MNKLARAGLLCLVLGLAGAMIFTGGPASALAGGPDAAGMAFADSAEAGGPAVDFEDISGTGTAIPLSDDSVSAAIPIGFDFNYYSATVAAVKVSSNGFVAFSTPPHSGCCSGQPMPTAAAPNNLVAAYWQDLNPGAGGSVKYQTLGTAPAQRFIVQWTNVPHYATTIPVTFQVKLLEATQAIEVQYSSALAGGFNLITAGIENATGTVGLSYCNPCGTLAGLAVRYADAVAPASTITTAGGSILVEIPTVQEDAVTGTATDDLSGVGKVDVTYTDALSTATTVSATVTCTDSSRHSCTWSSVGPALPPGPYTVSEQATDRAGNAGASGAGISVLVV